MTNAKSDTVATPTKDIWAAIDEAAAKPIEYPKCDDGEYTVSITRIEQVESPNTGNPSIKIQCVITDSAIKDAKGNARFVRFFHTQYFPLIGRDADTNLMLAQRCARALQAIGYTGPPSQVMQYADSIIGTEVSARFHTNTQSNFQNVTFRNVVNRPTTDKSE